MSDFEINGKVAMNGASWGPALARMRIDFDGAFKRIGNSFRNRLLSAVSASGVAFLITRTLTKGNDVDKQSARLGVTLEQFQTLERLSDRTGYSVEDLAEKLRKASLEGGDLTKSMRSVVDELKGAGLVISDDQVAALTDAFITIGDVMQKATIALANVIKDGGSMIDKVNRRGFVESMRGGKRILAGSIVEGAGSLIGNNKVGNWLQRWGLEQQLKGYGPADTGDGGGTGTKSALGDLIAELKRQREVDLWWKDIGGDQDWTPKKQAKLGKGSSTLDASQLTQIGGSMAAGASVVESPQVEQLRLLNRKVTELIGVTRKGWDS